MFFSIFYKGRSGGLFLYNSERNLMDDKYLQGESGKNALVHFYCRTVVYCALRNSKGLKISYDWNVNF